MEGTTLPKTYLGSVRYPFNLWNYLLRRPKGFVVWLDFNPPLERKGKQSFTVYLQIQLWQPELAKVWYAPGTADFESNLFSFRADDYADFSGRFDPSRATFRGTIAIKDLYQPHEIEFKPWTED